MEPKCGDTVDSLIDTSPISRLQWLVVLLCFMTVAVDGFDTAVIGFLAPAIANDWSLAPKSLVVVFAAGLIGSIFGALIFGPICDVIGRTRALVIATMLFGLLTMATVFAQSPLHLTVLRFLAGIGLGGVVPCAIALATEYSPQRRRSLLVNMMFCGFTLGSASSGFIAAWLIPEFGWRAVLVIGGAVPVAIAILGWVLLPESLSFLATRPGRYAEVQRIVVRLGSTLAADAWRPTAESKEDPAPVRKMFSSRPFAGTLLLWLASFCGLLTIYLVNSWMPLLLTRQGYSIAQASLIGATFQGGGTLGAILLGHLMDGVPANRVIAVASIVSCFFLLAIQMTTGTLFALGVVLFFAGLCISGSQVGMYAYTANWYPTAVRATGVSWMTGTGRVGSLAGSIGGGALIGIGLGAGAILSWLAVPMALAGVAMFAHERVRP